MAREPKKIKVTAETALTPLLEAAAAAPLLLEKDGEVFRLDRLEKESDAGWADYEPDKVHAAIDTYAGIWADRDADAMIARIYRARAEGSRPTHF
jgi:hypothetical protein